jgi:hypothetical protein
MTPTYIVVAGGEIIQVITNARTAHEAYQKQRKQGALYVEVGPLEETKKYNPIEYLEELERDGLLAEQDPTYIPHRKDEESPH